MAGNSFGNIFRITSFGESHGPAIGVIIDGCPAGIKIEKEYIQQQLDRRKPGQSDMVTQRAEEDEVHIFSGIFDGQTTGTPIGMVIYNKDMRSGDYDNLKDLFRPGHADYTYYKKYGIRDHRGSGRSSARETAARVAGGAVAMKLLENFNISITGYICSIGKIKIKAKDLSEITKNKIFCPDTNTAIEIEKYLLSLKEKGDSTGGIVECIVNGVPAGLGEPVFDKLSADLAKAMLSINASRGFEIGDGFACSELTGSENNDPMISGCKFESNHAGGMLGGISNGNEIIFRVAFKPTSSIKLSQKTIDIHDNPVEFSITGRHDPCVAIRAVPVVEAMTAITLADHLLRDRNSRLEF